MGSTVAVDVIGVSKRFRLYREKYQSLKERVLHAGRNPYEDFWALRDVSFDVNEGETVGMLGRNGSGKSTMLKCISGILQPTDGRVQVRGQLAALLELGAGFQPELSGRDNVFLNASLLGLSTKEVERRFDDIVAFAELEPFIDNQVKYYSSGMFVRLGFAVAVNVDPDILVVDEVLAVGDENFQRKCLNRIRDFQAEGRTILFVTHAADLVRMICDRALVLDSGRLIAVGEAAEAIREYHDQLLMVSSPEEPAGDGLYAAMGTGRRPVVITGVDLDHPGVGSRHYLLPGERLEVRVTFESVETVDGTVFTIAIYDRTGPLVFASDTEALGQPVAAPLGTGRADFIFDAVPLLDGAYTITVGICSRGGIVYDRRDQAAQFEVMNPGRSTGMVNLPLRVDVRTPSFS